MIKIIQNIHPIVFLIVATTLEVSGDALIRKSMYNYAGVARFGLMILSAILLFGYGFFLNLAPVAFEKVVGLYIATLFIVWQIISYISFRTLPTLSILVGGALVITGGVIITFWRTK